MKWTKERRQAWLDDKWGKLDMSRLSRIRKIPDDDPWYVRDITSPQLDKGITKKV